MSRESENASNDKEAQLAYNNRLRMVIEQQMTMIRQLRDNRGDIEALIAENMHWRAVGVANGALIRALGGQSVATDDELQSGLHLAAYETPGHDMAVDPALDCYRNLLTNIVFNSANGMTGAVGGHESDPSNERPARGSTEGPIAGIIDVPPNEPSESEPQLDS